MKVWLRYVILGVAAYFIFLVTQFPADRGYALVRGALAGAGVKLYGIEGSLWHGRASGAELNGQRFDSLTWEMHPLALLTGAAEARVALKRNGDNVQAVVGRGLGGVYVDEIKSRLSVAELVTALKIPAVKLGGQLRIDLDDLEFDGNTVTEANGTIGWYGAATQFPQSLTLGDLSAKVETTAKGIEATLGDGGGPLELAGKLLIEADGKYKLNATLSPREGPQSALAGTLRMMGRADARGKVTVNQSGNLADFNFLLK